MMPKRLLLAGLLALGWLGGRAEAYDRQAAVRYADQWASNDVILRNSTFVTSYDVDCTNFVSQTQIAGNRRFDFADGFVDTAGALPRVAELRAELEARGGNVQSLDFNNPATIPVSIPRGNPAFLLVDYGAGIYTQEGHSILNVGAYSDVDQWNPTGVNLLRFDGHSNDRHHMPFNQIPFVNRGWIAQGDVHILTLQDAPVIKYVEVSQVKDGQPQTLDWWTYDDDYNPATVRPDYYFHTYNGLHSTSMDGPIFAKAGEVTVKIIFDTPMRQNNIAVTMGTNNPDYNQVTFQTVGWSNTHQVSDTWTGKATIPQGALAANGLNFIKVNAFAADSSQTNQNSYLNGYVPAPDTNHVVRVDTLPPAIMPKNDQGATIPSGGATNGHQLTIKVDDTQPGIIFSSLGRLEIFSGDLNAGGTQLASNSDKFDASHVYTSADTGLSILDQLPEGQIFVRATDQAGNDTSLNFTIQSTPPPPSSGPALRTTYNFGTFPTLLGGYIYAAAASDDGGAVAMSEQYGWNPSAAYSESTTHVTKFQANGSQLWSIVLPQDNWSSGGIMATDGDDNVYLLTGMDGLLRKYAAGTGELLVSTSIGTPHSLVVDHVRGILYTRFDDGLAAYNTDLHLLAHRPFPGAGDIDLALDSMGNVYAAANIAPFYEVRKYSAGLGTKLWSAQQDFSSVPWDMGWLDGLAATGDGGVLLLPVQDPSEGIMRFWRVKDGAFTQTEQPYPLAWTSGMSGDGKGRIFLTGWGADYTYPVVAELDSWGHAVWNPALWENTAMWDYSPRTFGVNGWGEMIMGGSGTEVCYNGGDPCDWAPFLARYDVSGGVLAPVAVASADGAVTLTSNVPGGAVTSVSTAAQTGALALAASSGLTLMSPLYDVSPDGAVFDPPAALRFRFDPTGVDMTTLSVYTFNGVSWDSAPIVNQWVAILSGTEAEITGALLHASLYGLFTRAPSGDTLPPATALTFPSPQALGVESAVGGVVTVSGSVADDSALTWTLTAASTTLASGSGPISGTLADWDTAGLTGYQTLTLSARDAFGNASSTAALVFVGDPAFNFSIGKKDSNVIFNKIKNPTGIAVRSDGLIWTASAEEGGLLLLTSSGAVVAEIGGEARHGHGRDDDEDCGFKSPQGLALDAADNLYVADKGGDRVVKLSPDGSQTLLQLAKLDKHGRSKSGSGPGEFKKPWDVAVDGNGDIYAADSGNHRIQVFDSLGTFLRQFGQGVLLSTSEIRGIALTVEGLWVSDKESERIYLFSRAGALIKSIGDSDSVVGEISRMRGLAADRLGALYIVEPNRDRVQKFDPQGKGLLAFGSKAGLSHAYKHAKRYLTQPHDAAVAPDGSLWITDAGRDRIVRYALPVSGYGVAAYSTGGGASDSVESARRVVDHKDGAKVERDDGAGVHVPKGALSGDLEITVEKGDEEQDKEEKTAKRREMKVAAVSEEVQYGPEGTTFDAPVTLTIPYDAGLIASQGIREDDLKVYYWNPTLKDWQAMPSTVDKQNKTVNAETNHFSGYQVQGPGGGIGVAAAIDEFGLRDVYAFPNPSRGGSAVVFRIQPGLADSVEVRVYDLSGRKVHSSSDFQLSVLDDGNGKGAQNTYDHAWSVSGVGSGVYTFVITAKKSGQTDIRKSGRVGVIK